MGIKEQEAERMDVREHTHLLLGPAAKSPSGLALHPLPRDSGSHT